MFVQFYYLSHKGGMEMHALAHSVGIRTAYIKYLSK